PWGQPRSLPSHAHLSSISADHPSNFFDAQPCVLLHYVRIACTVNERYGFPPSVPVSTNPEQPYPLSRIPTLSSLTPLLLQPLHRLGALLTTSSRFPGVACHRLQLSHRQSSPAMSSPTSP